VVLGKLIKSSTSVSASSIRAASLGIGSDLIGDPACAGAGLHVALDCHGAFLSGQSAVAVAARWLDLLKLLEVELGDGLQLVGQFRSFEVVRDVVEPGRGIRPAERSAPPPVPPYAEAVAGGAARAPRVGDAISGNAELRLSIAIVTFRDGLGRSIRLVVLLGFASSSLFEAQRPFFVGRCGRVHGVRGRGQGNGSPP
jgi:hypothetical protein